MINEEIIDKAIDKAKARGFKWQATYMVLNFPYQLIFSHDFAKAFFGEGGTGLHGVDEKNGGYGELKAWQFYLREMVIADDPIKYLERFLTQEV